MDKARVFASAAFFFTIFAGRAARLIDKAGSEGFATNRTRAMEFAGDQGHRKVIDNLLAFVDQRDVPELTA